MVENLICSLTYITSNKNNVLNIYPNPVQTDLFIDHKALSPFNYSIYAINSAIALQEGKVFGEKSKINVALLPKGVYIIKFTIDGTTVFHKFIKE